MILDGYNSYCRSIPLATAASNPFHLQRQDRQDQRRNYHATPRTDLVLYGSILLVAGLAYAGYKTARGEPPLTPLSALKAQDEYRRLEQERLKRNEALSTRSTKIEKNMKE